MSDIDPTMMEAETCTLNQHVNNKQKPRGILKIVILKSWNRVLSFGILCYRNYSYKLMVRISIGQHLLNQLLSIWDT